MNNEYRGGEQENEEENTQRKCVNLCGGDMHKKEKKGVHHLFYSTTCGIPLASGQEVSVKCVDVNRRLLRRSLR